MKFERSFIPSRGAWSSPFCKWQGTFSTLHPLKFAADVTTKALAARNVPVEAIDDLVLGWTIPSKNSFYGTPWIAGLIGAPALTGAMISQACATSVAAAAHAAARVETGACQTSLVILADKTSNLRDLAIDPPVGWDLQRRRDYFDWSKRVIDQVRGVHPGLEAVFDEAWSKRP